jgi:threonine dehydratase
MYNMQIPAFSDIAMAHERIAPYVHRTPVLTSQGIDEITGLSLFFKCAGIILSGGNVDLTSLPF